MEIDEQQQRNNNNEQDKYNNFNLIEDDLCIFLERRWIITINFHNQKFQENIRKKIKNLQQQLMKSLDSKQQPSINNSSRKGQMPELRSPYGYYFALSLMAAV
jgi:Mg2+ and Co2+ transporter CorA